MQINPVYPWLDSYWQNIQSLIRQSRLPHAIMLKGADGLGIEQLATSIASSLLCHHPEVSGYSCGKCSDCKLVQAGTHPDFHKITVLEGKKQIGVEQIRDLVKVCSERPHHRNSCCAYRLRRQARRLECRRSYRYSEAVVKV